MTSGLDLNVSVECDDGDNDNHKDGGDDDKDGGEEIKRNLIPHFSLCFEFYPAVCGRIFFRVIINRSRSFWWCRKKQYKAPDVCTGFGHASPFVRILIL